MKKKSPRKLDHVVFPVPNLEVARSRYEQLGFNVAPAGEHRFGTENACIKFSDGTFIEPLTIGQRETVEANIKKGNTFLLRDAAYRFRNGEEGFWGISLGSDDVRRDRKMLRKAGYRTGKLVNVKRKGVHAKLSFALDERAQDFSLFYCQDMIGASAGDPALVEHQNGATGISTLFLGEQLPEDFQYYLQIATGQRDVRSHSFGMEIKLANSRISALNPAGQRAHLGLDEPLLTRGIRAIGVEIAVKSISTLTEILDSNGVAHRSIGKRLLVDPEVGQGPVLAFIES